MTEVDSTRDTAAAEKRRESDPPPSPPPSQRLPIPPPQGTSQDSTTPNPQPDTSMQATADWSNSFAMHEDDPVSPGESAVSEQGDVSNAIHETNEQLSRLVGELDDMVSRQGSLDDRLSALADQQAAANRENEALRSLVQEACEVKADFGRVKDGFNQLIARVSDSFSSSEQSMTTLKEDYRVFAVKADQAIAQKDDKIESLEDKNRQMLRRVLEDVIVPVHDRLFSAVLAIEAANEVPKAALVVAILDQIETSLAEAHDVHVIKPGPGSIYDRSSMSAVDFEMAKRFSHQNETIARTLQCGFHVGTDADCKVLRKANVVVYRR